MAPLAAELWPHPAHPSDAVRRIDVAAESQAAPSRLCIRFRVEGDIGRLRLPPAGVARRRDELWQHTCFEAFLRPDTSDIYYEFNLAPSGDWAAYRFGGRRVERSSPDLAAPAIRTTLDAGRFELSAEIALSSLPELAQAGAIHVGLTAVVESGSGELSYWALTHRGEKPDFHDPATFLLRVSPE